MKKLVRLISFFVFFTTVSAHAQKEFRVAFYNCENLMDTIDNPETRDDEFTPRGTKRWNSPKYYHKIRQLSKALISMSEWNNLGVLALAEVENRKVVEDLLNYSALRKVGYKVVHFDSPDRRGIDVALIYDLKQFTLVEAKPLRVDLPGDRTTRDILFVKGLVNGSDTLRFFVNHWPSRWGGQVNSEPSRIFVADYLRNWIDEDTAPADNIILLGDFNDTPKDKSVLEILGAKSISSKKGRLFNLMLQDSSHVKLGTHVHNGVWSALDQIIVSAPLLNPTSNIFVKDNLVKVHRPKFMMIEKDGSEQVHRSFRGAKYEGGFSDHLPVYVDLVFRKKKQ